MLDPPLVRLETSLAADALARPHSTASADLEAFRGLLRENQRLKAERDYCKKGWVSCMIAGLVYGGWTNLESACERAEKRVNKAVEEWGKANG